MDFLKLSHVEYAYHTKEGETKALDDISFSVRKGEFVAIVGPSGCGKSTLLHLIAGLLVPSSGDIEIEGVPNRKCRQRIGYMLQHDHLLPWRTTYENITLGLEINHRVSKETKEKVDRLIRAYGLEGFRSGKPAELSGGMRQRAALIRTLVMEPELLLLDEPFSALDYQTRLSVADDICSILRKEGKTAVLITHDISEAISIAERIIVLSKRPGRIKQEVAIELTMDEKGRKPKSPLEARSSREFGKYYSALWKELMDDA